jgi:flagellar biogenesis protein FliO
LGNLIVQWTSWNLKIVMVSALIFILAFALISFLTLGRARKGGARKNHSHQRIRASDSEKLTPEQEHLVKKAQQELALGKPLQASQFFEQAGQHRQAVSVLEEAGFIDEACAVLLRMERPARAAAVYARHAMHQKSADYYLKAGMKEEAAAILVEGGKTNAALYEGAARIFEDLQNYQKAIFAYALSGKHGKVAELVFKSELWILLLDYMCDTTTTKNVFAVLSSQQVIVFVEKLPLDTRVADRLAQWSNITKDIEFALLVVNRLIQNRVLLQGYWQSLSLDLAKKVSQAVLISVQPGSSVGITFLVANARGLYDAKRYDFAADLYLAARRYAMAGKCFALAGDTLRAQEALKTLNDFQLLQCFNAAMMATRNFQPQCSSAKEKCHPEVVAALARALDHVDPDSDESAAESPFSLVG